MNRTCDNLFFEGEIVSFGVVVGKVCVYKKNLLSIPKYDILKEAVGIEWKRFIKALELTKHQLLECKKHVLFSLGEIQSEVFDVQLVFLDDSYILQQLKATLHAELKNVEYCFKLVVERCIQKFKRHDFLQLRDRYSDLNDVAERVLKNLLRTSHALFYKAPSKGSIVFAESLDPSDVMFLEGCHIGGIVLEDRCLTSHAIVLAKGLGIPILVGVVDVCKKVKNGSLVKLDGNAGKVILTSDYIPLGIIAQKNKMCGNVSKDGVEVEFWLSYDNSISLNLVKKTESRGIGLFRSEVAFLNKGAFLEEDEQFEVYKAVVERVSPYPVVLRTLDIGGDKLVNDSLEIPEANPFLGLRAIRYCLKNENIFKAQLRAMLRASAYGNAKILYPMITSVEEVDRANEILEVCKKELRDQDIPFNENIEVGVMVEVPSAVLILDQLSKRCKFFSVGTNDLVQYTLAVDRTSNVVADYYQVMHLAVLRVLKKISEETLRLKVPVCVCGEMAGIVISFLMCLGLGFRSFTVYVNQLSKLQQVLAFVEVKKLQKLIVENHCCSDSKEISGIFEKYYFEILNEIEKIGSKKKKA